MKHEPWELKQMQSLPLEAKVGMTKQRLRQWAENWNRYEIVNGKTGHVRFVTDTEEPTGSGHYVERNGILRLRAGTKLKPDEYVESVQRGMIYISRSGGKDSDVLGDIAREEFPDVPHVFINTGLEYTSVRKHGEAVSDVTVRPEMPFNEVLKTYGYPVISKEVAQCVSGVKTDMKNGKETKSLRMSLLNGEGKKKTEPRADTTYRNGNFF